MSKNAKLDIGDDQIDLPIIEGSEGEKAIDISRLRGQTSVITMDQGLVNTGVCLSGVTFLNGEKGILRYRGYSIEELAEHSNFTEVAYLLLHGELPNNEQLKNFDLSVREKGQVSERILNAIQTFSPEGHPMAALSATCSMLGVDNPQYALPDLSEKDNENATIFLMAQLKSLAAAYFRHSQGKNFIASQKDLSFTSDFIHMMFGEENKTLLDESVAKDLDTLFILHADHEQNCSTSTVRIIGSSRASLLSSVTGGINALWGPAHGGANQAVIEMLENIKNDGGSVDKFLERAKDKNDPFRLMGFGHRVYKNFDPRANIIKKACNNILSKIGVNDSLLALAKDLEEKALEDSYFVERKLYPNVDFYSGIIYRALGIPSDMFTAMFVLGRLPGWMAQWREMMAADVLKIGRPRQIYVGENLRPYKNLKER